MTTNIVEAFGHQIGRHEGRFTLRYTGSKRWDSEQKKVVYEAHPLDAALSIGQRVVADRIDIGGYHSQVRLVLRSVMLTRDDKTPAWIVINDIRHGVKATDLDGLEGPHNSVLFEWVENNHMSWI